jgi:hypothetical protein
MEYPGRDPKASALNHSDSGPCDQVDQLVVLLVLDVIGQGSKEPVAAVFAREGVLVAVVENGAAGARRL